MRTTTTPIASLKRRRRGLTLIEVSISTLLVGLVLVSSMRSFSAVIRTRMSTSESGRAEQLAQALMTEIVNELYVDEGASPLFGPEESTTDRSAFDDVDDFHLWTASPPVDRTGTPLPNLTNWQRDVTVEYVTPADPATISVSDQGVKRITITVMLDGVVQSQLVGLRSDNDLVP